MALTGYHTPFFGSVTATTSAQSLWSLLSAVWSSLPHRACFVQLQLDTGSGATSLYVGGSNVASNMCGANLNANQAQLIYAFDSNLISLDDIYLLASASTVQVNVTVNVR